MRPVLVLVLVLVPVLALADPCARSLPGPPRPVGLALGPADFATTPSACPSTSAALSGRAGALIDAADFYGALGAEVVAAGTYAFGDSLWLSASLAALECRYVQNATLVATALDLGPATVAVHWVDRWSERARLAPFVRALLPTGTAYAFAIEAGVEPGLALVFAARR